MKRIFALLLCMLLMVLSVPVMAVDISIDLSDLFIPAGSLSYCIDDGVLTIAGSGAMDNYTVSSPAPWTSSGEEITKIVISDGITTIGNNAFNGMNTVEEVEIPSSVVSIGSYAFRSCTSLEKVNMQNGLRTIGSSAFNGCTSLKSITLPDSVTSIGTAAFFKCTALNSVHIPASLTSIESDTFSGCSSLSFVVVPESVTTIGDCAFDGCTTLWGIAIPASVTSMGYDIFPVESGVAIYTQSNSTAASYAAEYELGCKTTKYTSKVGDNASATFYSNCILVISGTGDMYNKDALEYPWYRYSNTISTVVIDNGITSIGSGVFFEADCGFSIPDTVTKISAGAFAYSEIGGITIPAGVTSIESGAFEECTNLYCLDFEEGSALTSIGDYAFVRCFGLTTIEIPKGVTSIGESAFGGCESIVSITVDSNNTKYSSDECGVLFDKNKTTLIKYPSANSAAEYTIPESVESIDDYAFYFCENLKSVEVLNKETTFTTDAFYGYTDDFVIYGYEDSTAKSYANATGITFVAFEDATVVATYEAGENVTAKLYEDGTLNLSGTGAMTNWSSSSVPWYNNQASIKNVVIENGVTSIGSYAFYNCTSLESIDIPDSVTSIGSYAFNYCTSLASVTFGENSQLTSIGSDAFYYCTSLESIDIPDSVTSIGGYAFYRCTSLVSVTFGENSLLTSIGKFAFYYCTSLVSIDIPDSVTSIGEFAFYYCTSLASVTIYSKEATFGSSVFYNCPNLTLYGYAGSTTETYANTNNIPFVAIDEESYTLCFNPGTTATVTDMPYDMECNGEVDVTKLSIPKRVGYIFTGWSSSPDEDKRVEKLNVTDDTTLYATWAKGLAWEFNTDGDFEGFPKMSSSENLEVKDGCYSFTSLTADPNCVVRGILKASQFKTIEIRMSSSVDSYVEMFYTGTAVPSFSAQYSIKFELQANDEGEFTTYKVNTEGINGWSGVINAIKLNPVSVTGANIKIDYVRVYGVGDHEHIMSNWITVTKPTCTEHGAKYRVCALCDYTESESIHALGHDYVNTNTTEPTCTDDGSIVFECQRTGCDASKTQVLEATGHDYGTDNICDKCGHTYEVHQHSLEETVVEPTCNTIGYTEYTCECGYSYRDNYIEQLGHKWDEGTVTQNNTCTADGLMTYACERCEASYTEVIPAGHSWYETVTVQATCTTDGEKKRACTKCGEMETIVIPAGHSWDEGTITSEPDCETAGEKVCTCSACGESETFEVPALGHNFVNGKCTRCGKPFIEIVTPDENHPVYGMYFEIDDIVSRYGPSLIDEYGVLLDYNPDAEIDKVGVYLTQDGTMWRRCIACTGDGITHATYVPYLAYQSDIKYTGLNSDWINIFRLSKNYENIWEYSNYATIGVNLEDKNGNLLLSLYDIGQAGKETRLFDNLEEMKAWLREGQCSHNWGSGEITTQPTCTETGFRKYTCSLCGMTKQEGVAATGHSYGDWTVTRQPTPTEEGEEKRTCSGCGDTETRSIEMLPVPSSKNTYSIDRFVIKDNATKAILSSIPAGNFLAELDIRNISSEETAYIVLATYTEDNKMLGMYYMYVSPEVGKTFTVGANIKNKDSEVHCIKAFIFDALDSITPLAESASVYKSMGTLTGVIIDAENNSEVLAGATLVFTPVTSTASLYTSTRTAVRTYTTTTDADGRYSINLPVGNYNMTATLSGYMTLTYNNLSVSNGVTTHVKSVKLLQTVSGDDSEYTSSGVITNCVSGNVIANVTVNVRSDWANFDGEIIMSVTGDSAGRYSVSLPAGYYTFEFVKDHYANYYADVTVRRNGTNTFNAMMVPDGTIDQEGDLRIVLTWGATPSDLDSHLVGPKASGTGKFHTYYPSSYMSYVENSIKYADLDLDDITSYGPETTTIYVKNDTGKYRFYVHDFTNRNSSTSKQMSQSDARVQVYNGTELIKTFDIPTNVVATLWCVFEYDAETGAITPINTLTNEVSPSNVGSSATLFGNLDFDSSDEIKDEMDMIFESAKAGK